MSHSFDEGFIMFEPGRRQFMGASLAGLAGLSAGGAAEAAGVQEHKPAESVTVGVDVTRRLAAYVVA